VEKSPKLEVRCFGEEKHFKLFPHLQKIKDGYKAKQVMEKFEKSRQI
jgi:hypothetical protein